MVALGRLRQLLAATVLAAMVASAAAGYDEAEAQVEVAWAGASYCCGQLGSGCEDWDCRACNGDMVNVTAVFNRSTDANGFVGFDVGTSSVVVAFAGTDPLSIQNWIDDLDFFKTPYPGCEDDGCKVHEGFLATWQSVQTQVRSAVDSMIAAHPSAALRVTGHSLGGAVAQLCALDLAVTQGARPTSLTTFGQPRTGNEEFTAYFESTLSGLPVWRLTHRKDPVPHLPLEAMGFHHEPTEVFYNELNTAYTVCDGSGEDPACSDQFYEDVDLYDHLSYLNFDFIGNYLTCKL